MARIIFPTFLPHEFAPWSSRHAPYILSIVDIGRTDIKLVMVPRDP
jgi:hypothetical protein